ncbi:MFS transporter [Streptomyces sp. SL13]|uniref:MFS transporter n=1 Tax=Streptantibioticus silvisoli TaxID=2705255 RepID=A0AA90HCX4_9ACTN|nr:MFS transporter [Streptantibioticus silvisoli]MDI5974072.1 MFS transporter [Streptantibioticus silvisoli]
MNPVQRSTLVVTMIATFLAVMDQFVINVALPSVRHDLHTSAAQAEFAVGGYALVYGALLITGGRLGDLYGHRRVFTVGVATFTVASLGCGLAPSADALIVLRVVQGTGAALFYPQILSFLQTLFEGQARTKAFALFGAAVGLAAVCGQVVGGALVSLDLFGLGWRPIFLVNVPLCLVALAGATRLPGYRAAERPLLDTRGVVLLTTTLLLLSLPLVGGPGWGWPWWSIALLCLSAPTALALVACELREARLGRMPLIHPELFRRRVFSAGTCLALVFFTGNAGLLFVMTLHLQQDLHLTALRSGLAFAPLTGAFIVASLAAPRIQRRVGLHVLTLAYGVNLLGVLTLLAAALLDAPAARTAVPWTWLAALTVIGVGQGLGVSPLMGAVLSDVPHRHAGAASGATETTAQVGALLGTVVVGLVFQSPLGHVTRSAAFTQALVVTAALAVTALLLMVPLLRPRPAPPGPPVPVPADPAYSGSHS